MKPFRKDRITTFIALLISAIILIAIATSCRSVSEATTSTKTLSKDTVYVEKYIEKEKIVITDSAIWIDQANTILDMLLKCDSSGNVLISQINQLKKDGKNGTIDLSFALKNNTLRLNAFKDSLAIIKRDIFISDSVSSTKDKIIKEKDIQIETYKKVKTYSFANMLVVFFTGLAIGLIICVFLIIRYRNK